MSQSNELTRQIISFIYPKFGFAWRQNSTGIVDPVKGFRASAKKGVADILACVGGRFIAIEIKIGKDHLSDEQIGFIKSIQFTGGIAMVVSSWVEFERLWNDLVAVSLPLAVKNEYQQALSIKKT